MNGLEFKSNGNGKCHLVVDENFAEEILHVPEENPEGDKVVSIYVKSRVKKIFLPATIESVTEHDESGAEIIFRDGLKSVSEGAFYNVYDVTFPASLTYIDEEAFVDMYGCYDGEEYLEYCPTIRAPKNSYAHHFAVKHGLPYMPTDCSLTWDADDWLEKFRSDGADYHALRREVWENTLAIVKDNGYTLPDGNSVLVTDSKRYSQFYHKPFRASFEKLTTPPEITVIADDCLDAAYKWVEEKNSSIWKM